MYFVWIVVSLVVTTDLPLQCGNCEHCLWSDQLYVKWDVIFYSLIFFRSSKFLWWHLFVYLTD